MNTREMCSHFDSQCSKIEISLCSVFCVNTFISIHTATCGSHSLCCYYHNYRSVWLKRGHLWEVGSGWFKGTRFGADLTRLTCKFSPNQRAHYRISFCEVFRIKWVDLYTEIRSDRSNRWYQRADTYVTDLVYATKRPSTNNWARLTNQLYWGQWLNLTVYEVLVKGSNFNVNNNHSFLDWIWN